MIRSLRSYSRLPSARRAAAHEAARELLRAWGLVRFRHFSRYASRLGTARNGDPEWDWRGDPRDLAGVKWAVERITQLSGGRFTCLMKAMAGQAMFARRGVSSAIVLGVRPGDKSGDPTAHAWLRVGPWIPLGGEERSGHIPVASYLRSVRDAAASNHDRIR